MCQKGTKVDGDDGEVKKAKSHTKPKQMVRPKFQESTSWTRSAEEGEVRGTAAQHNQMKMKM